MIEKLIEYNNETIGISIIDLKDRLGLTALHYSVIYNNFDAFKILIENGADPYILSKDQTNVFQICLMYRRNIMLEYLIDKKYNINFTSGSGETLLQLAVNYQNEQMINKLLETNINLSNITYDYGLNILHQSIILGNIILFKKLLEKSININIPDFFGNTPLHYILSEKHLEYLSIFFSTDKNIKLNLVNINGETPLHLLLDLNIDDVNQKIIDKIILETDLNIQDNNGITCLMKIINNNLQSKFRDLLVIKPLNFYIEDNNSNTIKLTEELEDIFVESFYNQIKLNKKELLVEWEKLCSVGVFDKLKNIIEPSKGINGKNAETLCKSKIRHIITNERRSLPKYTPIELNFDNGIFTNFCYYTGSPIDILFGIILLKKDFMNNGLRILLDYPLSINEPLEKYYKKIGLDYPYKLDFSNFEINWIYQKIFFPSYFDNELVKILKTDVKYIVIPIGIETSIASHANILFWDVINKRIERFEPNGSNYPMGLNYNPELLDTLLENKFKQFDPDIQYFSPFAFLPTIGFQILENLETNKCKKIGDPNGFCGVWCIWWVYQSMLNITNQKININNVASEIIKWIKLDNQSFKTIIRNFSKKITENRDSYLKKYSIDINDWIIGNYTIDTLDKLEKDIFKKNIIQ
jgi:ankyrin repeat protein